MSAFSASKYALAGFTEAVRAEVEPLGVHIGQVRKGRNLGALPAVRTTATSSTSLRRERILGGKGAPHVFEIEVTCSNWPQVHPGLVKSNFMERAEFFGKDNAEERKSFRQLVGVPRSLEGTGLCSANRGL